VHLGVTFSIKVQVNVHLGVNKLGTNLCLVGKVWDSDYCIQLTAVTIQQLHSFASKAIKKNIVAIYFFKEGTI
jgi:hypothetical protein